MNRKVSRSAIALAGVVALATTALWSPPASASEPFLGTIQAFGFNFPPRGWATCDGQLLPISQNTALFSLLGTMYGGNGQTTFALPDLRGRVPIHMGQGPGLSPRNIGEHGGAESVTLTGSQMPAHTHAASGTVQAQSGNGDVTSPGGAVPANDPRQRQFSTVAPNVEMRPDTVTVTVLNAGGSQPHNNMPPYLVVNYSIALQGIYPSRN